VNTRAPTERAAALLAMHAGPGFVLPDAWDAGSARILEQVGFRAIATTSAGIAWSCGLPDGGGLDRDGMLEQVNARTDTYFAGTTGDAFAETVERAVRYVEVGADCIFVPGVVEPDTIRRLAAAIPGPLNVVAGLANTIDAPALFSLGVTRVSLGGSLARASLSMLERAGRELLDSGTLGFLDGAIGYADLQRRFGA
jgi:2-methylisocitrate lyase-like PEP mutase family enzyme